MDTRKAQQTLLACYGFRTEFRDSPDWFEIVAQPSRWRFVSVVASYFHCPAGMAFSVKLDYTTSLDQTLSVEVTRVMQNEMREAVELLDGLEQIAS